MPEKDALTHGARDAFERAPARAAPAVARGGYYRPELDMLRLFAFLCVFIQHGTRILLKPWDHGIVLSLKRTAVLLHDLGGCGLPLFFFLSSYLITTLLVLEKNRTGAVHLRGFYVRRMLRIWPLYFGVLTVTFTAGLFWPLLHIPADALAAFFLISANWFFIAGGALPGVVSPLWSISVEEQFYIVWPLLVRRLSVQGIRNLCRALFVLSLVCIGLLRAAHSSFDQIWFDSGAQLIFFASGALLALRIGLKTPAKSAPASLALAAAGLALWTPILALRPQSAHPVYPLVEALAYLSICGGCAALLGSSLTMPAGWIRPPLVYFGRISYGLYVFHAFGLVLGFTVLGAWLHNGTQMLVALAVAVLLAVPSYELYEKPFLKLKQRFEFVHSRPVSDAAIAPVMPTADRVWVPGRSSAAVLAVPARQRTHVLEGDASPPRHLQEQSRGDRQSGA